MACVQIELKKFSLERRELGKIILEGRFQSRACKGKLLDKYGGMDDRKEAYGNQCENHF